MTLLEVYVSLQIAASLGPVMLDTASGADVIDPVMGIMIRLL